MSPDGTSLAVYDNTGVYIYDTESLSKTTFKSFDTSDYDTVNNTGAVAFSSDGNIIAISGKFANTPVNLWNVKTGKLITSVVDLPFASGVTKIQFSPDENSIFIRSFYGFTQRCEQADANFSLYLLDLESPKVTKIFSTDICQTIPTGFIRFANKNKFLLFVQIMGPQYSITSADITPSLTALETTYDSFDILYDVSPNGKIYAFMSSQENLRETKVIDIETSKLLETIPYKVEFLDNNESHFLVRDFISTDDEWKLWENGKVVCNFDGPTSSNIRLSANGNFFTTTTPENDVIIWKVSDCSIKNILHFGN